MREEMISMIAEAIKAEIEGECKISFLEIDKGTGTMLSVVIYEPKMLTCSSIYIDEFLKSIENENISLKDIAQKIVGICRSNNAEKFPKIAKTINKKDEILKRIVYQMG